MDRTNGTGEVQAGPAAEPQPILTPLTEAAIFVVLTVDPGSEEVVRDLLADVGGLTRSVGFRIPDGGLTCVVGLGSLLWSRLFGEPRPAGLHPFREIAGPRHTAVSTPGDVLFHLRAHRLDSCFELANLLVKRLEGHARVVEEVHGFKYFDERDLLGFVDGTENPTGRGAFAAAVIGDEDLSLPAAVTSSSRSTFMISGPGTSCPSRSRGSSSAARSSMMWRCPTTSSRATPTWL